MGRALAQNSCAGHGRTNQRGAAPTDHGARPAYADTTGVFGYRGMKFWSSVVIACAVSGSMAHAADGQFDCLIEPYQTIVVRSPVTGVIDKLFVTRGSTVKQGAPLVRLDSRVEN